MRSVIYATPRTEERMVSATREGIRESRGLGETMCVLLALASAVWLGSWLGIRSHKLNAQLPVSAAHEHPSRGNLCSGIRSVGAFEFPMGYDLIDVEPIGGHCFALFKGALDAQPTTGLSNGGADVFGKDGRLLERFFAVGRPNGQWELFEYRRLPDVAIKHLR